MLSARTTGCLSLCVVLSASVCLTHAARAAERDVRVLVWDEQQPRQKQAYDNFLGNAIAAYLQTRPGLVVRSTNLNAPQQGLSDKALDECDVLVWWGHVRQSEVSEKTGQAIVQRIKSGRLSLIALHSAHWSTPFVQAMYERTRFNVAARFPAVNGERVEVEYIQPPKRYYAPKQNDLLTPSMYPRKYPDRLTKIQVYLPNCCFPGYRPDGKPSYVKTVLPDHPIANGVPASFQVAGTEMYNEPFHVPEPDQVVFEERWPTGEWFRSGAVWNIGRGRVFYFRPGHETYPVYKERLPLKIVENAVRWLGNSTSR